MLTVCGTCRSGIEGFRNLFQDYFSDCVPNSERCNFEEHNGGDHLRQ